MDVKEALCIGGLTQGWVVAGEEGLNRTISTIEVMEVPEVSSWATPGVLVLTSFYSIKDDSEKQVDIIKALIDREAAGIVIKLGRFIDEVPETVKSVANTYQLPIITIPKSVLYNDVLTPINNQLFQEKQQSEQTSSSPLQGLDFSNFHTLKEALENISVRLLSPILLEDIEGRLLYHSQSFQGDAWREDTQLFSKPSYSSSSDLLSKWVRELADAPYVLVDLPGQRNRLLLPLVWHDELIAIVHIKSIEMIKDTEALRQTVQKMNEHLSPLFMMEQVHKQKERISDLEWVQKTNADNRHSQYKQIQAVLQFKDTDLRPNIKESHVIDYDSIVHYELQLFMNDCTDAETIIFMQDEHVFALAIGNQEQFTSFAQNLREKLQTYNAAHHCHVKIALSTTIPSFTRIKQLVNIVKKTMDIGVAIMPEKDLYLYEEMGIYVILLELTSDEFTQVYTQNILRPLQKEPELLDTLQVYIDTNGNISQTADQLYVHRRTVDYRMDRISKALNVDVKDSTSRFTLKFALMMQQLSH